MKRKNHYSPKKKGRISIEQYNREIKQSEKEVDRGEFLTQEEVEKKLRRGDQAGRQKL